MLRYFLDNREMTETDAATAWFERAENHGFDVPKAIGVWEDAAEGTAEARCTTEASRGKSLSRVDQNFSNASRA